jgi:hypothetical protein
MARTDASLIYKTDGSTEQLLAEVYAGILDNFQTRALSAIVKNQIYSGDPRAGSVEFDRMLNTAVENYNVSATDKHFRFEKVTVNLNLEKMLRERARQWDVDQYGPAGIVERKADSYTNSMVAHADRAFFTTAVSEGTELTLTGGTNRAKLDELIRALTDAETNYADGIDENQIVVFLTSSVYDSLKSDIDTLPNPVDGGVRLGMYGGVQVYRNFRQTADAIAMVKGAGAQPIAPIGVKVQEIPGSVDFYVGLYFKYGVKMLMPELVRWADWSGEVSA